jgi:hypothetical protein
MVQATWSIDATAKKIYVAVEAPSTGWVAFGISEAAAMRGADIMMGHVESDGKVVVGDYHATGNTVPIKDGCQVCVGGCMVCALGCLVSGPCIVSCIVCRVL